MDLPKDFDQFTEIWCADYEFTPQPGGTPQPICVVAHEVRSGHRIALWEDTLTRLPRPPYTLGCRSLFVAFAAQAELACHLAFGWRLPVHVIDLHVEFRNRTNGMALDHGHSLLGALAYYNMESLGAGEKESMRHLAIRGGPWTGEERTALLEYCATDVDALLRLLPRMAPRMNLFEALVRGRYVRAVAHMEHTGIPIDRNLYELLMNQWERLKETCIDRLNPLYGSPYRPDYSFDHKALLAWSETQGIEWPRAGKTNNLARLDKEILKDLALVYPRLEQFRQLRKTLGQLRIKDFPMGSDDRSHVSLWPFSSKTGRNQPKVSENILGAASFMRSLIQAKPGNALVYVDWAQQEYGVAAKKSGDKGMQDAYVSGDPYLALARRAKAVPANATKDSHSLIRERYKIVSLGILYGMGVKTLSRRIGGDHMVGQQLLRDHQQAFPRFWEWSTGVVEHAILNRRIATKFGWQLHCVSYQNGRSYDVNPRSIANFPMQATGAEMLRLACCLAIETGVKVCAPVHDALLIEAPLNDLEDVITHTQKIMARASELTLNGFVLGSDVQTFAYPGHYVDKRGLPMWDMIGDILHIQVEGVHSGEEALRA